MGQVLSLATRHLRLDDDLQAQLSKSMILQRPGLPSPFGSFSTFSDLSESEDSNSSAASSPVNTPLSSSAEWTARSLVALPAKPELTRARQRAAVDTQGHERRPRSREAVATKHERTVTAPAQMSPPPATDPPPVEVSAHEDLSKEHLFALILEGQRQRTADKEESERARQRDKAAAERVRKRDQAEANRVREQDRAELREVKHQLEKVHGKLEDTLKVEGLQILATMAGGSDCLWLLIEIYEVCSGLSKDFVHLFDKDIRTAISAEKTSAARRKGLTELVRQLDAAKNIGLLSVLLINPETPADGSRQIVEGHPLLINMSEHLDTILNPTKPNAPVKPDEDYKDIWITNHVAALDLFRIVSKVIDDHPNANKYFVRSNERYHRGSGTVRHPVQHQSHIKRTPAYVSKLLGDLYARTDGPIQDVPDSVIRDTVVLAASDKFVKADGKQIFLASDEA